MKVGNDELVGLQRAEFSHAARIQDVILMVQLGIAAIAGVAVFVTSPVGGYFVGLAGAVLAVVWAWLNWKFEKSRGQAERTRRATMLVSGLGLQLSRSETLGLSAGFSITPEFGKRQQDPFYYSSAKPVGEARLEEMLEETAFWSGNLMKICASRTWAIFTGYFLVALLILFVGMPLTAGDQVQQIAKLFCLVLTFLISGEVLGAARKFSSAAAELELLFPRIEAVKAQGSNRDDLMLLLLDYNAAVEGAPVIPERVYRRNRDRLNALWLRRN